jgi:2-oxoisovalerate dehydrogenase E2 component (dihydrolipoyl transacylase)
MSQLKWFKLPDLGEGCISADIVRWHVRPGDRVASNQVVVEVETAFAFIELPSPYTGVVDSLVAAEGQTAEVGTPIIAVQVGGG